MFWFESALNASGDTSFKPGDFSFASFSIATFISSHLMEWSMSGTVSCCSMSFVTYQVTGR